MLIKLEKNNKDPLYNCKLESFEEAIQINFKGYSLRKNKNFFSYCIKELRRILPLKLIDLSNKELPRLFYSNKRFSFYKKFSSKNQDSHAFVKELPIIHGKVKCRGLRKEDFNVYIDRNIQPHGQFFINHLINKDDTHQGTIYCIIQISEFDFFPIPFKINNVNLFFHETPFKLNNYYYFPVKYKQLVKKENNNLTDIFYKDKFDDFYKHIIKIVIWNNLIFKSLSYASLIELLGKKYSKKITLFFLCILFIIVTFVEMKFIPVGIKYYFPEFADKILFHKNFISKLICFGGFSICAYFIFPGLNIKTGKVAEKFVFSLFSVMHENKYSIGNTVMMDLSGFDGMFRDKKKKQIVYEWVSKLMRYQAVYISITIALISLLITLILKWS